MTTRDTFSGAAAVTHPIGRSGRLVVLVADWDVQVTGTDGEDVTVRAADGEPLPNEIEIEPSDDAVTVTQTTRTSAFGFLAGVRRRRGTLVIELPAGASANVRSASGDVAADSLQGEQQFRTASGDVRVAGSRGTLLTETVSGDVSVTVEGTLETTIKTVSGDVVIDGGRVDRLKLMTTSGDVRITSEIGPGPHAIETLSGDALVAAGRGVRIFARTVAGDLSSDLPHTSDGGPGRRSIVIGDGKTDLQFRSVSGDLRVVESGASAVAPVVPAAPAAAAPAAPPTAEPAEGPPVPQADNADRPRLDVLRALERGEIDVAEATRRLANLDDSADV